MRTILSRAKRCPCECLCARGSARGSIEYRWRCYCCCCCCCCCYCCRYRYCCYCSHVCGSTFTRCAMRRRLTRSRTPLDVRWCEYGAIYENPSIRCIARDEYVRAADAAVVRRASKNANDESRETRSSFSLATTIPTSTPTPTPI